MEPSSGREVFSHDHSEQPMDSPPANQNRLTRGGEEEGSVFLPCPLTDLAHLTLLIERLQDADMISEGEEATLLTEADAALQSLEAGDREAVRAHVARIARFTETLIRIEALTLSDGRAVIQAAQSILKAQTDPGG
jgi:hypothetical protein